MLCYRFCNLRNSLLIYCTFYSLFSLNNQSGQTKFLCLKSLVTFNNFRTNRNYFLKEKNPIVNGFGTMNTQFKLLYFCSQVSPKTWLYHVTLNIPNASWVSVYKVFSLGYGLSVFFYFFFGKVDSGTGVERFIRKK